MMLALVFVMLFAAPAAGADRPNARERAAAPSPSAARAAAAPQKSVSVRAAAAPRKSTQVRAAAAPQKDMPVRAAAAPQKSQRAAPKIAPAPAKPAQAKKISTRAAYQDPSKSTALGSDYGSCRDAYFACMDQFCANRNEQYRRCTCSARLSEMRGRERNFSAATGMIKDFEDNNLHAVDKSPDEVKAMYSATEGESTIKKDASASAKALSGISDVLSARGGDSEERMGNMTEIWGTTDLVGGANLAELESTALYQAVHAQCAEITADSCGKITTAGMVSAAYG
ncbi:MAG: hypothetical protein LBB08_01835, partial [Rickettsiales bacterium]|nr:hypothetical protein [Rickettsiales bacterium]